MSWWSRCRPPTEPFLHATEEVKMDGGGQDRVKVHGQDRLGGQGVGGVGL